MLTIRTSVQFQRSSPFSRLACCSSIAIPLPFCSYLKKENSQGKWQKRWFEVCPCPADVLLAWQLCNIQVVSHYFVYYKRNDSGTMLCAMDLWKAHNPEGSLFSSFVICAPDSPSPRSPHPFLSRRLQRCVPREANTFLHACACFVCVQSQPTSSVSAGTAFGCFGQIPLRSQCDG